MGSTGNEGIPLLTGPNYENWRFRVKLYLDAAEVSSVLKEEAPSENAATRAKWEQTDRKAKSLLVRFLSDECLGDVREEKTAWKMWKALEDTYAKRSVSSQTLLRKQLARLRMKDGSSMRGHFQVFDDLVRQLKSAGAKMEETDLVAQLFLTLPDSYDPLVTALENLAEKDLTLSLVKQRLLAEESKRTDRQDDSGEEVAAAFIGGRKKLQQRKFSGKCHRCGRPGHMKRDCRWDESEESANFATSSKAVTFMANRFQEKSFKSRKIKFCVDSGSSDHLVNDVSRLQSVRKLQEPIFIEVAKEGVSLKAEFIGELVGRSNRGVEFRMKNVIVLPELRQNLLSVKKLSEAGIEALFSGRGVQFKLHDEVIGEAYLKGSLYELELDQATIHQAPGSVLNYYRHKGMRPLQYGDQHVRDQDSNTNQVPLMIPMMNESEGGPKTAQDSKMKEANTWALPSHQRRDDCLESTTRRSEWERGLPGKFPCYVTKLRTSSAVGLYDSTDSLEVLDIEERVIKDCGLDRDSNSNRPPVRTSMESGWIPRKHDVNQDFMGTSPCEDVFEGPLSLQDNGVSGRFDERGKDKTLASYCVDDPLMPGLKTKARGDGGPYKEVKWKFKYDMKCEQWKLQREKRTDDIRMNEKQQLLRDSSQAIYHSYFGSSEGRDYGSPTRFDLFSHRR